MFGYNYVQRHCKYHTMMMLDPVLPVISHLVSTFIYCFL